MKAELITQEQFDVFADEVARELGTHCRTAELADYGRGLGRLVIDGDGRALRLCQPDDRRPAHMKIYAALPDETILSGPSIGVTARSASHVAREITRRLYPLHAEASQHAAELAAQQEAEENGRRAVAEAVTVALPGARIEEQHRRTRSTWEHDTRPPGEHGPVQVNSTTVVVGPSGDWLQAEASGHPDAITPMLAAFAQASRG
ncbi:hypothetical protein [Streptomyces sp. NPDC056690]|uniref:hypothetical protein n=1 Tax=unclassified Streptomyces TaxID=2593676 RepID=UPI00362ADDEA